MSCLLWRYRCPQTFRKAECAAGSGGGLGGRWWLEGPRSTAADAGILRGSDVEQRGGEGAFISQPVALCSTSLTGARWTDGWVRVRSACGGEESGTVP